MPKRDEMGNEELEARASVIGRQEDLHLQLSLQLLLLLEIPTTLKSPTRQRWKLRSVFKTVPFVFEDIEKHQRSS
jgi:hypothetical protein